MQNQLLDKAGAAREYAIAWNSLRMNAFISLLAEDVLYESQMVIEALEGKQQIARYLREKIQAVKNAGTEFRVAVELGTTTYPSVEPCAILYQGGETPIGLAFFKVGSNTIQRIDICNVPDPWGAKRSGEFRGLQR